jgi:hypothetical protein
MQLLQATEISSSAGSAASTFVADGVAMPSAEMLLAVHGGAGVTDAVATVAAAQSTSEVSRVLEDALSGGGGEPIDALLQVLAGDAGSAPGPAEMAAFVAGASAWDMHDHAGFMPTLGGNFLAMEAHLEVPTPL